jgi:hypothetical protein
MTTKALSIPTFHSFYLPLSLILLSALDAYFTLICIQRGGQELNPFMRLALLNSVEVFFSIKMLLTIIPAIILSALHHHRSATYGLYIVNLVYIGILSIHLINFSPL